MELYNLTLKEQMSGDLLDAKILVWEPLLHNKIFPGRWNFQN